MNLYHDWLAKIRENEQQREAFVKSGHTVVVAGPGSGKTRVLAVKISQLLREEISPPQGVACLTYTRMMAHELESRLAALHVLNRPNVLVGTVHSFCLSRIVYPFAKLYNEDVPFPLRIAPSRIWDECLDKARRQVTRIGYDPEEDRQFRTQITKYHLQHADIPFAEWQNEEFAKILEAHYAFLKHSGYIDFDIVVKTALHLVVNNDLVRKSINAKFAWLAIDEYQDLGYPLFRIIASMIERTPIKLFAIGDPDQSIFDFAGTDPKYLLELTERPEMKPVVKLVKNYRATREIIQVSKAILTPYCDCRSDKQGGSCHIYETLPNEQGKFVVDLVRKYLKQGVDENQIAVLHSWRISKDGLVGIQALAQDLQQAEIDFTLDKNPYYDRSRNLIKWLEGLGSWCLEGWKAERKREIISFDELTSQWYRMQYPQSSGFDIDGSARLKLAELAAVIQGVDMHFGEWLSYISGELDFDSSLSRYQEIYPDDLEEFNSLRLLARPDNALGKMLLSEFVARTHGVQLTTLHSSKGMEFQVVIIAGVERIWDDDNGKRLLYVGVTRAEREVCLLYSRVWPPSRPRAPKYIQNLVKGCGKLDYFHHTALA